MTTRRIRVGTPSGNTKAVPSVVAIPKFPNDSILCGMEATDASPDRYEMLYNWKMLLGFTTSELHEESLRNNALDKCLKIMTIDEVAIAFFKSTLSISLTETADINPSDLQLIVGIPPSTTNEAKKWRENYKRRVAQALQSLKFKKPKFWPEPFAVFQYLKNLGEIQDTGVGQNVLIIDVGGGTTNVCLIKTTMHGRLARGGSNFIPHGVRSINMGGSTLDHQIARELAGPSNLALIESILPKVKAAKEDISNELNALDGWGNTDQLGTPIPILDDNNELFELTGTIIKSVFQGPIWKAMVSIIEESISEVIGGNSSNAGIQIGLVVLAGGTCQMKLVRQLFENQFASHEAFQSVQFCTVPDYRSAVAHGLAIEATANSRHHDIMPSRVSSFLQEDLRFKVSHRRNELGVPLRLQSKSKLSNNLKGGVLIEAPTEIINLLGEPLDWQFNLRQKSQELFYEFAKINDNENEEEVLVSHWKKLCSSGSPPPGKQMHLNFRLQENGFAEVALVTQDEERKKTTHQLDPIDLHDLSGLEGDVFFGLDFGTDSTEIAFVNATDPSLFEALPGKYRFTPQIERSARELEARARDFLKNQDDPKSMLQSLNEQSMSDYVYHSNRIEGSILERGRTKEILESNLDTALKTPVKLKGSIRKIGIISPMGEITGTDEGRVIADSLAAINLRDAFQYVEHSALHPNDKLTAFSLREIHSLVMKGSDDDSPGQYRNAPVSISQTTFVPPDSMQVVPLMEKMFERFESPDFIEQPALIKATEAHARFVSIHPFMDGNGRVARLLANYYLWSDGLPGVLLPWENRDRYYDALEECNSKELDAWGDITDLTAIFCDAFEDALGFLEGQESGTPSKEEDIVYEPVITDHADRENSVSKLLSRISKSSSALTYLEQYDDWKHSMEGINNDVQDFSNQFSRGFRSEWGGTVEVRSYDLIDFDTYKAIRNRQSYSRTWFMKIKASFPNSVEELVFFFAPNSKAAIILDPRLSGTCSMHISKLDRETSRHVDISRTTWSRIVEITHNGNDLGVLRRERATQLSNICLDDNAETHRWFSDLIEDIIVEFSSIELIDEPN